MMKARDRSKENVGNLTPEQYEKRREYRRRYVEKNKETWYQQCRDRLRRKPWIRLLVKARVRCKESGLEYALSKEWAVARWTGRCELTGIEFAFCDDGKPGPFSPSLDRVDSKQGYTPNNCRFVLWAINRFKGEDSDADLLRIARALVEHG